MQDILVFLQHHLALSAVLIGALVLLLALELIKTKQNAARLSAHQLTNLINHNNALVVDLRKTEIYNQGHIVGAISIPYQEMAAIEKKLSKFKSQPIVLVCNIGRESQQVANFLRKNAFEAYVLAGGTKEWTAANMPLIKAK